MDNIINIDNFLRLDIVDASMVLFSTLLIVAIVKKFFWKYASEYLEKRAEHIKNELDESTLRLKESEDLKQQYAEQMANAKQEASGILAEAKAKASKEASEIITKAKNNSVTMKEKAFADIENERAKVKSQIKEEISEVAFLAAKKVVEKELDESVHKKYVDDFIEQAGIDSWQA